VALEYSTAILNFIELAPAQELRFTHIYLLHDIAMVHSWFCVALVTVPQTVSCLMLRIIRGEMKNVATSGVKTD
ncbi:hypothetical protein, partial [Priestia megaterium]|uniref:hypothetical protein n=1 Tax=Priestia megaterium TaxID=1404 RepID=UPI0035B5DD0C